MSFILKPIEQTIVGTSAISRYIVMIIQVGDVMILKNIQIGITL